MGMHPLSAGEARGAVEALLDKLDRPSGLGDVILKLESVDGRTISGRIVERDGESSQDGVLLGAMSDDTEQRFMRWDEIVWLAAGVTDD